jgi:transporter family protein
LSVVFVIVLGVVVLGEPLTWKLAAGAALVVAGVVLIAAP